MKNLRWMLPIVIGILVFLPATVAAQTLVMRADIPFNFVAGEKMFSAGRYLVSIDPTQVVIRATESDSNVVLAYASHAYRSDPQNGRLLFNSYGNTHILRKVWVPNAERGSLLPAPRVEREALARVAGKTETTIAAIPVLTR
jgi:hypothetical protein